MLRFFRFQLALAFLAVVVTTRAARADDLAPLDSDRLGLAFVVGTPLAGSTVDGDDRTAGGLLLGVDVRGVSRFEDRRHGLVFDDDLALAIAGCPVKNCNSGAAFVWRYDAALGYRAHDFGVFAGASIDTAYWSFAPLSSETGGGTPSQDIATPSFVSASIPLTVRVEIPARAVRITATAFAAPPALLDSYYGGELSVDAPHPRWLGVRKGRAAVHAVSFYLRAGERGGESIAVNGSRTHTELDFIDTGMRIY